MSSDPIIEEVRKRRDEYAKKFNYDLKAIYVDLKKQQARGKSKVTSFSPKPVKMPISGPSATDAD